MKLSYYTINDLRLGRDPRNEVGWRLSQFLDWQDALALYRALPNAAVKSLGVTNGEQVLELVRCLPLFPNDTTGEDVLVLDLIALPFWNKEESVIRLARELVNMLNIRYCLAADRVVPAPTDWNTSPKLEDVYLWPDTSHDPASAIRWLYVAGTGWLSPKELKRRFPAPEMDFHYPLIDKYRADGVTSDGTFVPLELTHWEYKMLEHRTQERLNHKEN